MYHSQHATRTSVHPAEGWVQVALSMLRRQLLAASLEAEGQRVQGAGVPLSMQHRPLCILQRNGCNHLKHVLGAVLLCCPHTGSLPAHHTVMIFHVTP